MEKKITKSAQIFLAIGTITTWFAVGLQFYLIILNRVTSIPEAIVRFLSFYTILTNVLVAICFTFLWLKPGSRWGNFFSQQKTLTAITVYITIVAIVYNLILRFTWNPQGLQRVVDELLHVFVPVYFILYWFIFAPKVALQSKNIFPWLIYPFVYLLCILFRGVFASYYPYPFLDVKTLGYNQVFLNSIGLFIAFLILSLLFVAITKKIKRTFLLMIVIVTIFTSCNNNSKRISNDKNKAINYQTNHCYAFTSGKDSVFMEIVIAGNLVTGNLTYKLFQKDKNEGTLHGTIKGDTLIADYKFMSEGTESVREVAFLKKGNDFIEGYGAVEEKNGGMIFQNANTINYSSNVILKPVECGK